MGADDAESTEPLPAGQTAAAASAPAAPLGTTPPPLSTTKEDSSADPSSGPLLDDRIPATVMPQTSEPPLNPEAAHLTPQNGNTDDSEKIEPMPTPHQITSLSESSYDDGAADLKKTAQEEHEAQGRMSTPDVYDSPVPPSLNYTLRTRKLAIAIFWSLILIDSIAIPLVLYFCLHYLTDLSPNAVFSISTACLGGISIVEYILRFWRLWRHNSTCRVLGARRWYLDWFHWNFSAAWIFIMAELIVGTSPDYPPIRLLAMPVSSLCFFFSLSLLIQDTMRYLKMRAPIRISSVPEGEPLRPGVYSIVEDICAVDGSGGTEFRKRLNARFEASHYFRQMLHRLTVVWAVGMLAVAIATTTLIFTLDDDEIAYIIGWSLPFVCAGFFTLWTFYYVKRCLKREYAKWAEQKTVP